MVFFRRYQSWIVSVAAAAVIVLAAGYEAFLAPPQGFPQGALITIERGASLPAMATSLAHAGLVKHPHVLYALLAASGRSRHLQAGTYFFESPQNALTIAYRIATGAYGITPVRVTFPEGVTVRDIAARVAQALPAIPVENVVSAADGAEGYLFPDTYFFLPTTDAASIVRTMRKNFDDKVAPLSAEVEESGHTLSEIVTVASLVEKEARTDADRRTVAGILWNRLHRGMPLQVDAVFGYIFGRDTYSPSLTDLQVESPYNTYLHAGLPPGAICNPGLDSIDAALHPAETKYLFYLSDKNGVMHYAMTYAEHQVNQTTYLN